MSWVLVVVGAIVGLLVVVFAVGASLYAFHRAISTAHFRAKPEEIWKLVSDLPNYPSWRTNLRAVERGPDHRGHPVWVEVTKRGMRLPLALEESVPPRRIVLRIAD
ncbi:MAG TPA: SRPBCC family protein, partial [Planctomycetota bacterium]|nr:SRPBCC family protein [Planctomycetota bacterium]